MESKGDLNDDSESKAIRGLISCVGNPYPLFAMATQSHLSTQPCQYLTNHTHWPRMVLVNVFFS
jgi:hypothetical protein